jgi:hypothetical protein
MYTFYQILHFILKNYLNFKLYENMLIILFSHIYILDVMYITPHLHMIKDFAILKLCSIDS